MSGDVRVERWYTPECTEGVIRAGEYQPCEKTAVAVRIDPQEGSRYSACAYHARGDMVPLSELLAGEEE